MPILTISRQHGSTGKEIGLEIAKDMGYEYIAHERIIQDMQAGGNDWQKLIMEFEEHDPTVWERHDWGFKAFIAIVNSLILKYALKDNVVIIGRGANFLLENVPYALRVRFEAPLEKRIKYIVDREDIDERTAKWFIQKMDKESCGYVKTVFRKSWDDPRSYDLVINTAAQSKDLIIKAITDAIAGKDRYNTEENRKIMKLWSVAADIRAGILTNAKIHSPTLQVEPVGETIVLRGLTHSPKEHNAIEAEARRLAGNIPIKCLLYYR